MKRSLFICTVLFVRGFVVLEALGAPPRLTLPQAEALLLQRNLAIVGNRYQLEASEALRRIAGFKPNPTLQLGAEQIPLASPLAGSAPRFFSTNSDAGANPVYTVQFNKIIERGGKRELRIQQADALTEAARIQVQDTFRIQLFQLRQAFGAALLARENLQLAEVLDSQYERTEQLTKVRVDAGDAAGVELYRVQSGRLLYKQAILDAQTAYMQAARDVLNLLNIGPDDINVLANAAEPPQVTRIRADSSSAQEPQAFPAALQTAVVELAGGFSDRSDRDAPMNVDQLLKIALSERPDVQVAQANLKAARDAVRLAEAQRVRDVSIGVEYQRVGADHSAGVVTQIPLFTYNNHSADVAQAQALARAAEAQLKQSEMQAETEVTKAYESYSAARRSLALYNSGNLVQVERLRSIADYSFRAGGTSLFELLDAQRTAGQAAVAYNQSRFNYQVALWQIEQAIGQSLE